MGETQATAEPCEAPDADPTLPPVPPPAGETDGCDRPSGRARRVARAVLPVLIAGGALYAAASLGGGVVAAWKSLHHIDRTWVAIGVGFELCVFVLLSLHLRLLAGPTANARRLAPFRTALVVFGLGSSLPAAPAEGLTMAGTALRRRRLSRRRALLVLGMSQWFATAGLYVLAGLDALVVAAVSRMPLNRAALAGAAVMALAGVAGFGFLLTRRRVAEQVALFTGWLRSPRHPPSAEERRERGRAWHAAAMHVVPGWQGWAVLVGSTTGAWLADALCLYAALAAVGAHVSVPILVLAYAGSSIAAEVPLLPAGVGIVETAAPLILGMGGVPAATALAAILLYRVMGTALPAAAGAAAAVWLRTAPAPEPETAPAPTPAALTNPDLPSPQPALLGSAAV